MILCRHLFILTLAFANTALWRTDVAEPRFLRDVRIKVLQLLTYDLEDNGWIHEIWPQVLSNAFPALARLNLVDQIMALVQRCVRNRAGHLNLLQFCEFCSGRGNLTRELLRCNLYGCSFDWLYAEEHNMMESYGIRLFFDAITSSAQEALHWWGTKCSSFVSLCVSVSLRHSSNSYLGDQSKQFVKEGNFQAEITSIGIFISWLCGCYPVLEQPISSVMPCLTSMRHVLTYCRFEKTICWMGSFNGPSPKPLQIWHPQELDLKHLNRGRPTGLDGGLVEIGEGGSWTGVKNKLNESEHYTKEFGASVAATIAAMRSGA